MKGERRGKRKKKGKREEKGGKGKENGWKRRRGRGSGGTWSGRAVGEEHCGGHE